MQYRRTLEGNENQLWLAPQDPLEEARVAHKRSEDIRIAVRAAIGGLQTAEREVIEGHYFHGQSLPRLARQMGRPMARIRLLRERAIRKLRVALTPFVEQMFGIRVLRAPDCPICRARWRDDAERILDDKTDDMTWGMIARRIERATGWQAPNPQMLKTHDQRHRRFSRDND